MRFKQGEPAIFAVANDAKQISIVGRECVVELVGPFHAGQVIDWRGSLSQFGYDCDYIVMFDATTGALAKDWQLRKIEPPKEPEALTRLSDVDEEIAA